MQEIEEAKHYIDDYEEWREESEKADNDEEVFYGSVFQEFNEQWQDKREAVSSADS